jgi:thiol-disulfide isomerase/thioredoxin
MTDNPTAIAATANTPEAAPLQAPKSNPILFLAACGLFMLIGIMVLAWLGTDRSKTAVGKPFPNIVLDPLLNVDQTLSTEQMTGKPTILYLWSPESKSARDELQRIDEIAKKHPDHSLITIAFSERTLVFEVLRDQTQKMFEQEEMNWPTYVDKSGQASMEFAMLMPFGSFGFPTIFVIDQQGLIKYVGEARKPENWDELSRRLAK